ncbi:MAG: hypothetical protein NXY59_05230 [Aigarchaeota archaeon]|nr:hypothetical protein [Candidatus Pelearchaeum maunauluense]
MPRYFRCVDEDTWLTESRSEYTWRAAHELAVELAPELAKQVSNLFKKRIASVEEVRAWTQIFFKAKDYKPARLSADLSRFYTPVGGLDTNALARELGLRTGEAAVLVRKLDKPLMVATMEEILQAVKHSYEHRHKIEFAKGRV